MTSNWATIDEAYICAECQAEIAADEAEASRLRAEVERLTEQLADVRVSMEVLHQQFVAAWGEVDRLTKRLAEVRGSGRLSTGVGRARPSEGKRVMVSAERRTRDGWETQWMQAFVAMWTDAVNGERARARDAIQDAVDRLNAGAPAWEIVSRLESFLSAIPPLPGEPVKEARDGGE